MSTFLLSAAAHAGSAGRAGDKVTALADILNRYYPGWRAYDGRSEITDVQTAITYAMSKKETKAIRQTGQAAAAGAFGMAGAAIGGTAGSVALPGAGTAVGAVTVGEIIGRVPLVATHGYRKFKALYKMARGTRGVHRGQAAQALYDACMPPRYSDPNSCAACDALYIIIGEDDFYWAMVDRSPDAAKAYIASKLKSW